MGTMNVFGSIFQTHIGETVSQGQYGRFLLQIHLAYFFRNGLDQIKQKWREVLALLINIARQQSCALHFWVS